MTPSRVAAIVGVVLWSLVATFLWSAPPEGSDGGDRWRQLLAATALLGTPLAAAGAVVAHRLIETARGRDASERLVRLATAGLGGREEWGAAMLAELACIDDASERRRFAIGCAVAALRTGTGPVPWLVAAGIGLLFATGTVAASRATLAGERGGIAEVAIAWPPLALFAVTFVTTRAVSSFRVGFIAGGLALLAGLLCTAVASMFEAARWHEVAGVFLMDGDVPSHGLTRTEAILDPVSPTFLIAFLLVWTPWPVLGAAAGSWCRRRA
jgi:hypothetical protein